MRQSWRNFVFLKSAHGSLRDKSRREPPTRSRGGGLRTGASVELRARTGCTGYLTPKGVERGARTDCTKGRNRGLVAISECSAAMLERQVTRDKDLPIRGGGGRREGGTSGARAGPERGASGEADSHFLNKAELKQMYYQATFLVGRGVGAARRVQSSSCAGETYRKCGMKGFDRSGSIACGPRSRSTTRSSCRGRWRSRSTSTARGVRARRFTSPPFGWPKKGERTGQDGRARGPRLEGPGERETARPGVCRRRTPTARRATCQRHSGKHVRHSKLGQPAQSFLVLLGSFATF